MIFSNQLGKLDGYTSEEAVRTIANHIRKMQEEMEYRLMTLDSSNISEISLDETKVLLKGQPLQNVLQDNEGMSVLEQTVNGLRATVADVSGNYTALSATVNGLQAEVGNHSSTITTLTVVSNGLSSRVDTLEGDYSTLVETSNEIYGVVYDMQDDVGHMLKLDSKGVYIVDNDGNVVSIHGGQIDASTVTASSLKGNTISVKNGIVDYAYMYVGSNSVGTDAFELVGTSGLRLLGAGNVYLQSYCYDDRYSAHITIGDNYVSLGGNLMVGPKAYGYDPPKYGEDGQVFFLLS
jgi:hypothetical protein